MGWLTKANDPTVVLAQPNVITLDAAPGRARNNADQIFPDAATYANYAATGYGRNELVYACIRYRAESLPQASLSVFPRASGEVALDDHPLRRLIENPNPVSSEFEFWELSSTLKDIAGTSFHLVVKGRDGIPAQLWPVRPDLVGVLPLARRGGLGPNYTWIYHPDPVNPDIAIPVPDAGSPEARTSPIFMIRVRYPNPNPNDPGSPYFGQPPLRAAARIASLDNAATDFVDNLLRNHAVPSVVIETEQAITTELHSRLKTFWQQAFSGRNRGTPAFLQKGMTVKEIGFNLEALEFPDLRDQSETRICSAFMVEPVLVGTKVGLTNNAYKDYHEARASFWEEAMLSEQRRWRDQYRRHLLPYFAGVGRRPVRLDWDNSAVPALKESQQTVWDRGIRALQAGGITKNDFRAMVGLPRVPNGDEFLLPSGATVVQAGDSSASAGSVTASYGMLAAEFGLDLSKDELRALADRAWHAGIE